MVAEERNKHCARGHCGGQQQRRGWKPASPFHLWKGKKITLQSLPHIAPSSVSGTHRVARGCGLQQAARGSDGELLASTTWRRVLAVLLVTLGPFPFSADAAA